MYKIVNNSMKTILLSFLLCLFLLSCTGTRLVIESPPSHKKYEPQTSQKKGGPPPWAPAHGYRAKHKYHYYPSSSIYYDTGRRLYFYYSGGNWRVSASLPIGIHISYSDYVSREMTTDKPYKYHSDVKKKYPPGQMKKKTSKKKKKKY